MQEDMMSQMKLLAKELEYPFGSFAVFKKWCEVNNLPESFTAQITVYDDKEPVNFNSISEVLNYFDPHEYISITNSVSE